MTDGLTWRVDTGADPAVVPAASALMQAEWAPPCLVYDASHLTWQLEERAGIAGVTVSAWSGSRCVAFAALTPRRARVGDWSGWIAIKSFMTVAADARGHGLGRLLRQHIVSEGRRRGWPLLRFGESASTVHPGLVDDYGVAGMRLTMVGECTTAAAMASLVDSGAVATAMTPVLADADVLVPQPDEAEQLHDLADPRGRRPLMVSRDGCPVACAVALRAVVRTRDATTTTVQLERLWMADDASVDEVKQLTAAAATWGYEGRRGMVTIPAVGDASWPHLASAGFRRMPSRYSAWVASADPAHPILGVRATRFEIV